MRRSKPVVADPVKSAKKAGLLYVHPSSPGIERKKAGKGFVYELPNGKTVKDAKILERIRSLGIPPAWKDVWICTHENGHLQATGRDARGRLQYLYHPEWRAVRSQTKYHRMLTFAEVLPKIRRKTRRDLKGKGMTRERVLAAIVRIMEKTLIRIGNEEYAKENDSFGLTTMRNKHVEVEGSVARFHFKGKSGVVHDVELSSPKLARIIHKCQEIPGQELFGFLDDKGKAHDIGSHDVNAYLQELSGEEITAKDFRTWFGSVHALQEVKALEPCESKAGRKKNIVQVVDGVSKVLGNTKAVCRKSYIHPGIFEWYLEEKPFKFRCKCPENSVLHESEHELVHFLKASA